MDRDVHADGRALAEPHEVDVNRQIPDRIELEVARDDAMLGAVDVDLIDRRQEMAGVDALAQFGIVDRDRQRVLVRRRR